MGMHFTPEELTNRFKHHAPQSPTTSSIYDAIRSGCLHLADLINELAPDCHEKDNSIDRLDEVMFWANAAVARNEGKQLKEASKIYPDLNACLVDEQVTKEGGD